MAEKWGFQWGESCKLDTHMRDKYSGNTELCMCVCAFCYSSRTSGMFLSLSYCCGGVLGGNQVILQPDRAHCFLRPVCVESHMHEVFCFYIPNIAPWLLPSVLRLARSSAEGEAQQSDFFCMQCSWKLWIHFIRTYDRVRRRVRHQRLETWSEITP